MTSFVDRLANTHSSQIPDLCKSYIQENNLSEQEIINILDLAESELLTFDDIDKSDVSDMIREGLLLSDFKWTPKRFEISKYSVTSEFISNKDSVETKYKLINTLDKNTKFEWLSEWIVSNPLHIEPLYEPEKIIPIFEEALPYTWQGIIIENAYYYNNLNLIRAILEPYKSECKLNKHDQSRLKICALTFLTKAVSMEDLNDEQMLYKHDLYKWAKDLYGEKADSIINTAISLNLSNDLNYWRSYLLDLNVDDCSVNDLVM